MEYSDEQLVIMIKGSKEEALEALQYFFKNKDLRKDAIQRILRENNAQLVDAEEAFHSTYGTFFNYVRREDFKLTGTLSGLYGTMSLRRFRNNRDKRKQKTKEALILDDNTGKIVHLQTDDVPDKYLQFEEKTRYFDYLLNRKDLVTDSCKSLIREKYWEEKSVARQALYKCLQKLRSYFKESSNEYQVLKNYALSGR